jgi:hypothetical protein
MTEIEKLVARDEIQALKARYFRCLDLKDWNGYGRTFAKDGLLEVQSIHARAEGGAPVSRRESGAEAIVRWVSAVLNGATTIHHGHMPEIEFGAPGEARGIWAMEDRVIWPDRWLHGWGHYHETYVREDGAWRIASSLLTRLRVELSPETPDADKSRPRMLDAGL